MNFTSSNLSVRFAVSSSNALDVAVSRESGTGTDHLLESAHPLIDSEDENEDKVLDDVVIGSIDVAHLKEELQPVSLFSARH